MRRSPVRLQKKALVRRGTLLVVRAAPVVAPVLYEEVFVQQGVRMVRERVEIFCRHWLLLRVDEKMRLISE